MRTNTRNQYSRSTSRQQRPTLKPNKNDELDLSQDSTQPQPSRVPQPILQTKIRKTHCSIQQIPECMRPQTIQQLYLSHNCIKSVKNKLRLFTSLRNLNLSYNLLTDVEEFVGEVYGVQQDNRPRVSIELRMLYLRMNKFGYGYEDVVIRAIPTLERFQDYTFLKSNAIHSKGEQNPQQVFQVAQRVSQYFLPAFYRLNQSIEQLHQLHSLLECCRNPQNLVPQISKAEVVRKYERCISELSMMIQPKKQINYLPTNRMQALMIIFNFEVICIKLGIKSRTEQANKVTFEEVVKEIILGFSQRNYHHFVNTLKYRAHLLCNIKQASNSEFTFQQLIVAFGETYGGRKYSIFQNNPGKYLHKIDASLIGNHPFYDYIKENNEDYRQEKLVQQSIRIGSQTLDGNRRKSKNTVYRRVENYVEHQLEIQNKDYLPNYQNLPIIVYERNYLQILEQIMVAKIKSLIRMYDLVTNELVQYQKTEENRNYISNSNIIMTINDNQDSLNEGYRKIKSRKKSSNVYQLDSDAYLYENESQTNLVQTPIFCQSSNAGGQVKKVLINTTQQIKQNKKVGEQLKQINIEINNSISTRQYRARLSPECEQNRKTVPKFARNIATSHNSIIRQSYDYKVQMKTCRQEDATEFKQNLRRYSIYEINLAYKVFLALKKKVRRAKRKKAKASINTYVKDTGQPTMENTQRGSNNATKQLKKSKLM